MNADKQPEAAGVRQSTIYDLYTGMPPHEHVDTSRDAAERIRTAVNELQRRVLAYLIACGDRGATSDQAEVALGMAHQTCSARLRELRLKGLAVDSGRRRDTRSGRRAMVVTATAAGFAAWQAQREGKGER